MTDYIYRVTVRRKNPGYWQAGTSVKVSTARSLQAQLKSYRQALDNAGTYGASTEPSWMITRIEQAPIGAYEDVTDEMLGDMK